MGLRVWGRVLVSSFESVELRGPGFKRYAQAQKAATQLPLLQLQRDCKARGPAISRSDQYIALLRYPP